SPHLSHAVHGRRHEPGKHHGYHQRTTAAAAVNSPFSVPVTLTITPATPAKPAILVTAMVNAASMNPSSGQAANSILAAFGTFPGCSSGAQVLVDHNSTTVFYSSPTQVNFLLPARAAGE